MWSVRIVTVFIYSFDSYKHKYFLLVVYRAYISDASIEHIRHNIL